MYNKPRPNTRPSFDVFEHNGKLTVGMPFNHTDISRVFVRLGEDIIRLSYADPILVDLKPVDLNAMLLIRCQQTLNIAERDERGNIIREYEAAIVAKD